MWLPGMIATHRFQYSEDDILIASRNRLPDQPYEVVLIGLNPGWNPKRSRRTVNKVPRTMLERLSTERSDETREIGEELSWIRIEPTCRRIAAKGEHDESNALVCFPLRRSFDLVSGHVVSPSVDHLRPTQILKRGKQSGEPMFTKLYEDPERPEQSRLIFGKLIQRCLHDLKGGFHCCLLIASNFVRQEIRNPHHACSVSALGEDLKRRVVVCEEPALGRSDKSPGFVVYCDNGFPQHRPIDERYNAPRAQARIGNESRHQSRVQGTNIPNNRPGQLPVNGM